MNLFNAGLTFTPEVKKDRGRGGQELLIFLYILCKIYIFPVKFKVCVQTDV